MLKNRKVRIVLIVMAFVIVIASLLFTNIVGARLAQEEQQKMEVWAEATRQLLSDSYSEFVFAIIQNNNNIPVIIADSEDNYLSSRNFNNIPQDTAGYFVAKIAQLKGKNPAIEIDIDGLEKQYIYYDDSILLKQLSYFPYVQLSIIALFLILLLWAFTSDKRSEQNLVWVGLSKETAHQLGTPITSLLAWVEILKAKYKDDDIIHEMGKDVDRLRTIAERFSKIGSKPSLEENNLVGVVEHTVHYMENRTSRRISYTVESASEVIPVMLNVPLFEWVIENLCKNAIDAMDGDGKIDVSMMIEGKRVIVDVADNGKGIERGKFKAVFRPGYTTKRRGWGLGLSLVKRIVEEYHQGKIYVKSSEVGKGTTFRISLPIAQSTSES